jgi:CHASE2 domain-containing sensor protein
LRPPEKFVAGFRVSGAQSHAQPAEAEGRGVMDGAFLLAMLGSLVGAFVGMGWLSVDLICGIHTLTPERFVGTTLAGAFIVPCLAGCLCLYDDLKH